MDSKRLRAWLFPITLFGAVVVLAAFRIHGSSVGMYNLMFYGSDYRDPNLVFGRVRPIRSDEWLVFTPWTISQAREGFSDPNTSYLAGQDFSLTNVPVRSWTTIFKPQLWVFFLLPLEQAYAFHWWFKAFLMAVAAYSLAMKLTGNRILVSACAALSLLFAPYVQWWFHTSVTETASFGMFTLLLFVHLVDSVDKPFSLALFSFLLLFSAMSFALILYPPFQVPLALLFGSAGFGYILSRRHKLSTGSLRRLGIAGSVVLVAMGLLMAGFYLSDKVAIQAMLHTVYPGLRRSAGGDMGLLKALAGFYNLQLLDSGRPIPPVLGNQSEAASFFFFSVLLLPFYLFFIARAMLEKRRVSLTLLLSLLTFTVLLLWGSTAFPPVLARLLLLRFVDSARLLFALGVLNTFLILYYLTRLKVKQTTDYRLVSGIFTASVFLGVLVLGNYITAAWPDYIPDRRTIFLISAAVALLMLLVLLQRAVTFSSLFLLFTMASAGAVNPLYRGLSPLTDTPITTAIQTLEKRDANAAWIGYENIYLGNLLASNGVRVLNGTYYHPNLEFWKRFDPSLRYLGIYNRYEHLLVHAADERQVRFKLIQADVVQLGISPCNPTLEEVGVEFHVFDSPQSQYSCLKLVERIPYPMVTFYVYQRADLE